MGFKRNTKLKPSTIEAIARVNRQYRRTYARLRAQLKKIKAKEIINGDDIREAENITAKLFNARANARKDKITIKAVF